MQQKKSQILHWRLKYVLLCYYRPQAIRDRLSMCVCMMSMDKSTSFNLHKLKKNVITTQFT